MAEDDNEMGPGGYALTGAGVGAAGVGSSVGLLGVSAAIAAAPVSIVMGIIGGLVWWAARKIGEDNSQ
jgi:hypothetical protein